MDLHAAVFVAASAVFVVVAAVVLASAIDYELRRSQSAVRRKRRPSCIEILLVGLPLGATIALLVYVWQSV